MALFLPQPKKYNKSHRKRKQNKSNKSKQSHNSSPIDQNASVSTSLDVGSIYRENQNDNLCKKHALATIISTVMSERQLSQIYNNNNDGEMVNDNDVSKHRKRRKLKRKWKSPNYLSREKYNKFCDAFDRANKFDIGISRKYFVIGETTKDNIFSYILNQNHHIDS